MRFQQEYIDANSGYIPSTTAAALLHLLANRRSSQLYFALSSTIPHTSVPQEINIVKYNTTYFSSTRNIHCQLQYHIQQTPTDSAPEDLFLPWHQLLCNCLLLCFSLDLARSTCVFFHQTVHWLRTCFFLHQKRKLSDI